MPNMFDGPTAGIINPGCQEIYCDGSAQVIEDDTVHSTLYVNRDGEKIAVMIVHMSRKKHAQNVKRIWSAVCATCTSRGLQGIILPVALALMGG